MAKYKGGFFLIKLNTFLEFGKTNEEITDLEDIKNIKEIVTSGIIKPVIIRFNDDEFGSQACFFNYEKGDGFTNLRCSKPASVVNIAYENSDGTITYTYGDL